LGRGNSTFSKSGTGGLGRKEQEKRKKGIKKGSILQIITRGRNKVQGQEQRMEIWNEEKKTRKEA